MQEKFWISNEYEKIAMNTVIDHFAVSKLPNFPGQDPLEVCLALLGSLHRSWCGFSLECLKEHSQLTIFNEVRNKANFVQQSNRVTVT